MKKECLPCGNEFETIPNGHTRKYCFNCVPQYKLGDKEVHRKAMQAKHKAIKKYLVEYKGGKCEKCSYNKCLTALSFHHIENNKEFGIAGTFHNLEDYKKEVDKCKLLCVNCHMEEHERLNMGV